MPQARTLHPWEWPGRSWFWVHMDYAGPTKGKWILVIGDACSKYIDPHIVSSYSSSETVRMLRRIFATYGSLYVIVSDYTSSLTSKEFSKSCALNAIKHYRCTPYYPSSNELAECTVQTIKSGLTKVPGDLETRLLRVLALYRIFPQSTMGQ